MKQVRTLSLTESFVSGIMWRTPQTSCLRDGFIVRIWELNWFQLSKSKLFWLGHLRLEHLFMSWFGPESWVNFHWNYRQLSLSDIHLQVHGIETVQNRKTRAQWVGLRFMWFPSEGSSRFHHQCCLLNRWSLPTAPLPSEHRGVDVTLLLQRLAGQTEALADQWPDHWHVRSSVWDWGNGSQTWSLSVIFLVLSWY